MEVATAAEWAWAEWEDTVVATAVVWEVTVSNNNLKNRKVR